MNFQLQPVLKPLKVVFVNPLVPASQLVIVKIMSGAIFGNTQSIDLVLFVSINEVKSGEAFKLEIESCAFPCTNGIKIHCDLSSTSDGDVFCFMTDFTNPNCLNFNKEDSELDFKALNCTIKLAKNFSLANETKFSELYKDCVHLEKNKNTPVVKKRNPIYFTDGLVTMDVLKSVYENLPNDLIFCSSPLTSIARTVLRDYLNVQCDIINDVLVWAASDEVFHVEVEKPVIINDFHCNSDVIGKDLLESLNLDSTQFNASWMKKEFIEKVASSALKNPYGCIYRAAEFSKSLRDIWLTRIQDDVAKVYTNMGVISDGSLRTIKGLPYILPIVFTNERWSVNRRFEEDTHLKMEIKRINKMVKQQHEKLISYCKNFLQENVIYQAFRDEDDSVSTSKY